MIGSQVDAIKYKLIHRQYVHSKNDEDFDLMNMTRYEEIQKHYNAKKIDCLGLIHENYLKQQQQQQ